ncbi:hypothetical protein OG539_42695 [Actinacidiphila glaucinigra]|uniref:hypothetical protein n=1 Tax=Actinacidiphila glaucinigra TaxID=235986 RepID=UPI0032430110
MEDLKGAPPGCAPFQATSAAGWDYRFSVKEPTPVTAGDKAVSYLITNLSAPEGKGNVESVIRTGGTLSSFLLAQGTGEPKSVPEAVARKQHERLLNARS